MGLKAHFDFSLPTPHSYGPTPLQVIVSTDVMARGVDQDRVNVVANLDLPRDSATYVHRQGGLQSAKHNLLDIKRTNLFILLWVWSPVTLNHTSSPGSVVLGGLALWALACHMSRRQS